jgi:predicted phage terminase large subunit-like protein
LSLPALAEVDETHLIRTALGTRVHLRRAGEPLHPERESLARIEEARRVMGTYDFEAQYQQRPAPIGGGLFKFAWLSTYNPSVSPAFDSVVQSWDTASKASEVHDWSVCTTWGMIGHGPKCQAYLLDVFRKRMEFPDLRREVLARAERFNANHVLIEDCASGTGLIQSLKADGFWKATAVRPAGDKVMRLHNSTAFFEAGHVSVPEHAPWLDAWRHELEMFPNSKFDDQVDSTSQAINWMTSLPVGFGFLEYYRREFEEDEYDD